jgi:hypothetical protein
MALLHAHTEEKNVFLLRVSSSFQFSFGFNKAPRHFTDHVKAISFPQSFSGSIGSSLYFLVKTIMLVFNRFTVTPHTIFVQPSEYYP